MPKLLKSIYFKLTLISLITALAFLSAIPKMPVVINSRFVKLDSVIGGYNFIFLGRYFDLRELKKGLDLEGGVRVVLKADTTNISDEEKNNALESAKEIITKRVDLLGVSEPYIAISKSQNEDRIIVELPGIDDVASAVDLIGQTAQLSFRQLKSDVEWDESKFQDYYYDSEVWEDTGVTGGDLKGADVVFSQSNDLAQQNMPSIKLKFTYDGREKFEEVAKNNVDKPIALFLDKSENPLSMPVVSEDLAQGLIDDPVITGRFDVQTAQALSVNIRAGALPVPVEVLEQKTIGATLGEQSIHKSFFAGVVGLILLFLFLIFMYGRFGILASVALGIYSAIVVALFKVIPVVLTLPGMAGFVLSIAMATDANILIFERIKEEIVWGRPKNLAINQGFDRAWTSIRDSNISSLLTAAVLFYFGTGPVRGFALTLAVGILVSLFTSIFVVRTFIHAFNIGGIRE